MDQGPTPGPDEVVVSVSLAGLSFGDVLISTGRSLPSAAEFPFTPGSEGIGVVETVGPDIEDSAPGDKEKARVPGANLVHQPPGMPDAEMVLFRTSCETATEEALRTLRPPPGGRFCRRGDPGRARESDDHEGRVDDRGEPPPIQRGVPQERCSTGT
ncbi:alcohol dehydrogenase catalytic domain-containing protein [Rhodococcus erythropolis]|uniref:alcohol dehydrogenase catalytic domain-containing protein n=1 Tax=Rhodococcus erythropolis TaxID=1833 RepID=UPI003AFFE032